MTASRSGHVDELFENYLLALGAVDQCPESADANLKWRLEENVERAEKAFADGAADGLRDGSAKLAQAIGELGDANLATRAALRDGKPIAAALGELEAGTELAIRALLTARA